MKHQRNIAQKITQSILSIAICSSLVLGITGVVCIAFVNNQSQQIYSQNLEPLNPLYKTQADFQSIRSDLKSMALESSTGTSSGTDYPTVISGLFTDMDKLLSTYEAGISSDSEKINATSLRSDVSQYKEMVSTVESTIKAGKITDALALMNKNNTLSDDLKEKISNAFTMNINQAQQRNQSATTIFYISIAVVGVFTAAFILASFKIGKRAAAGISLPIGKMVTAAGSIADGNLDVDLDIDSDDETGVLADAFKHTVSALTLLKTDVNKLIQAALNGQLDTRADSSTQKGDFKIIIEGINSILEAVDAPISESAAVLKLLAEGDLTAEMTGDYQGSYDLTKKSLNKAIDSFNSLLGQISVAADQVSVGSGQVSAASQSLAQGATEQASSIEELTSTITEVSSKIRDTAENAKQASEASTEVSDKAQRGNEHMQQMLASMNEINEGSSNISKIIKVIDDIAFQTNILALNAAVEAARAGQAGKGFAVVAEEVRNLAEKSAKAAKETASLIETNIEKVGNGTKIANETAAELNQIVEGIEKSAAFISNIASASNHQASAITQIDSGIEQVSTVVQTNSATAEESAASSEELSGQAESLKHLINQFRLKENEDDQLSEQSKAKAFAPKPVKAPARKPEVRLNGGGKY
jgi:methyl-accepting chemotaxis protein